MLPKFTDRGGREWPLEIEFPDVSRIKKECDVDLLTQEGMARITRLESSDDYELLGGVMYIAWAETADKHSVTDAEFGRIVSQSFNEAARAFNEALADFFHRVGRGPMARMIRTAMAMSDAATKKIDERFSQDTFERLLTKSMQVIEMQQDEQLSQAEHDLDRTLGNVSSNSEHSAESPTSNTDEA